MPYKLTDNVIARVAQILQEGILLGVDIVDLLRQVEVVPVGSGEYVDLTAEYTQNVQKNHQKLLDEADVLRNQTDELNDAPKTLFEA